MNEIRKFAPWFHNLHLPDEKQTAPLHPLGDFPNFKWREIESAVPRDLHGWNILDIGCNAGFYTFELAKRGGTVTGIDIDEHYLAQARWAARKFGLEDRVTFRLMQVYDLAHSEKKYDLVWFMGVFYHLRYPLLALDIVARVTRRMIVFQTLTLPGEEPYEEVRDLNLYDRNAMLQSGWPKMAFIEHSLAGDPTNWWAPNHSAALAMVRSCGLRVDCRPSHEVYVCVPNRKPLSNQDIREQELRAATGRSWREV